MFSSTGSKKAGSGSASPFSSVVPNETSEVESLRQQLAKAMSERNEFEAEVERLKGGVDAGVPSSGASDTDLKK